MKKDESEKYAELVKRYGKKEARLIADIGSDKVGGDRRKKRIKFVTNPIEELKLDPDVMHFGNYFCAEYNGSIVAIDGETLDKAKKFAAGPVGDNKAGWKEDWLESRLYGEIGTNKFDYSRVANTIIKEIKKPAQAKEFLDKLKFVDCKKLIEDKQ